MKRKFILTSLALTFCMGMYAEQPVTVETDSMRRIDLEEVMIHATKTGALLKDLPNRVEVVTKRQIEASGINNLTDLLKNFVNVDVIEYPGYNSYFSIRGFKPTEGKYTTVLIDGVPAGTTNMATLSLGDVEQVEVLKGPFSAMYGSELQPEVIKLPKGLFMSVDGSTGGFLSMPLSIILLRHETIRSETIISCICRQRIKLSSVKILMVLK